MPSTRRLLKRAYDLIEDDQSDDAVGVLEAVLRDDPHNIEAWELYMQIVGSRAGLESLAERVRRSLDLTPAEKDDILSYQEYILKKQNQASSRSALIILAAIFVLLVALWVAVPDIRSMTPFYLLVLFVIGLAYSLWRSDRSGQFGGVRSYSYGVSSPRLVEREKPELFYHEPIIKVGPLPEEEEEH